MISSFAGYFHLYDILWFLNALVIEMRFLHLCRVNWERSGSSWTFVACSSSVFGRLKAAKSDSFTWKKCIHRITSLGTSFGKKNGLGTWWILSMVRSEEVSEGITARNNSRAKWGAVTLVLTLVCPLFFNCFSLIYSQGLPAFLWSRWHPQIGQ